MDEDGGHINKNGSASSVSEEGSETKQIKEILEHPERQINEQDGRHGNADVPSSSVSEEELGIKELLEQTVAAVGRVSKRLHQHADRRVNFTQALSLWYLRFLELELSVLSESLKQLPLSDLDPDYINSRMSDWLTRLSKLAKDMGFKLDNPERAGAIFLRFFGCRTTRLRSSYYFEWVLGVLSGEVTSIIDKHLLLAAEGGHGSRTISLQPHHFVETDARSMPLVGIESALGNKGLRWFMDDQGYRILKIVSMVGPVGVGKTAIAMEVYRRLQIRGGEPGSLLCCATAKVSRRPDMKKLLLHILSQIDEQTALAVAPTDELEQLIQKISRCLQDRRYLIVLDDIWKISDWDIMKNAFPQSSLGGRIVITTRIRSIAHQCCSYSNGLVHEVKSLGETDSRMLLFRNAFGCEVNYPPENFRQVCTEILRRCEGIPLFINGMADWLQQQQQEMQHMSNHTMEEVPKLLQIFEQVLSPTYDDLPGRMKVLLLFMNMLPEGYIFEMDTLQRRWEWEGLLLHEENSGPYFSELTDRNVITPVANWKGVHQLQEDCQYKVNYFMLQFLASKSADKGFVCTSGWLTSVARNKDSEKLRRISLHQPDQDVEIFLKRADFPHTRSLAISSTVDGVPLDKFIHLIVLDLEGWQCFKDEDLLLICNSGMFLLNYFSLKNTSVSRLPPEIKKLRALHTLLASHTQISEIPSEVCELRLQSVDLRNTQIRQLPEHIWKVHSLTTLLVGGDGVNCNPTITDPPLGRVLPDRLTTLKTVDFSKCSARFIGCIAGLVRLEVLCIRWPFQQCTDANSQESLCRWRLQSTYLKSLTIHCVLGYPMEFLTCQDYQFPCHSLEKFKVTGGRFVSIPPWFHGRQRLASIEITVCRLDQEDLMNLASLPLLKCLILGLHFVPEKEIVIYREGFPSLWRLSVCCRVPWLTFSEGAMPSLACLELKIGGGPMNRERIPSGLGNIHFLREVALHYNAWYNNDSNVMTIVDAVKKGVAQHHNPINLVINGIQDEEEYGHEAGDGVAVINSIPDQTENLQKVQEDAARATERQSEIEILGTPELYDQSLASQDS